MPRRSPPCSPDCTCGKHHGQVHWIPRACEWCGDPVSFERQKQFKKNRKLYCGDECGEAARVLFANTRSRKPGPRHYRLKALRYYGEKCMSCGYDRFPALLDVHHIDRNHENDRLSNLVVLCVRCHAETHWMEDHFRMNVYASRGHRRAVQV